MMNGKRSVSDTDNGPAKRRKGGKTKGDDEVMIKGAWSPEEDDVMKKAVSKYGTDWKAIAKCVRGRTAKQCRDRYKLKLDPSINHGPWSPEEDATLLRLHEEMGRQWTKIAKLMKGRTENSVKSRFASLQRSKIREWTEEEDKLLWEKRELGMSHEEIAESLLPHRSVHSIKKRYERLYMRELAKKIRSEMPASLKQSQKQTETHQSQTLKHKPSFPINPRLVNAQVSTAIPQGRKYDVGALGVPRQSYKDPVQDGLKVEGEAQYVQQPDVANSSNDFHSAHGYPTYKENGYQASSVPAQHSQQYMYDPSVNQNQAEYVPQQTETYRQQLPKSSRQAKFKRYSTSVAVLMDVIGEGLEVINRS